jgi:molybdopterin molybdotransferase
MLHVEEVCDRPGLLDVDAALAIALRVVAPVTEHEVVPLRACTGRVTSATATSAIPLPPFDQSAVDGYGIHTDDVADANMGPFPIVDRLVAGSHRTPALRKGEAVRLLTGAAIPKGVAAVVMEEKATATEQKVTIGRSADAGLNIRRFLPRPVRRVRASKDGSRSRCFRPAMNWYVLAGLDTNIKSTTATGRCCKPCSHRQP